MAERLECWSCNPEEPSSSPTLTASWICSTKNLSFKFSTTLVNSQLVCLRPVGILNKVMFNSYVDLIIYSTALKSPDGEMSLEVVFFESFLLVNTNTRFWRSTNESFHRACGGGGAGGASAPPLFWKF